MQPAEDLNGSWQWVSSVQPSSNTLFTPDSEGYDGVLQFTATSNHSGTFRYSREGSSEVHGDFGVASEDVHGNDFIAIEPEIDFLNRNARVTVGTDQLILSGVMEGGYLSTYARIGN